MKKFLSVSTLLLVPLWVSAQLAWDTEFKQEDFNNALTVISKTENVSWNNGIAGLGANLSIGKIVLLSTFDDECVVALPQTGIAEKLYFGWQGASNGTISIYQSPDHENWSQIFTTEGNTIALTTKDSAALSVNTRYLKFAATGHTAAAISGIRVSELKRLSSSTDEWPFGSGMVDDADAMKSVTVSWTNIIAEVSSTDPHFSATVSSIGQKNLIDQSTTFAIVYSHSEAGEHSGEIVISGEGREIRIGVSGSTSKYSQSLTWTQTLDECITTDNIHLNAFASSELDVVYLSSDSTIAYVEENIVHILRSGTVTFTATQPGNYKYLSAGPIEKTLVIHKADPVIQVSAEDLTYGQPLSEAVLHENNGFVAGSLSWEDISPDTVLNAGDYVLSVLFTPADTGIYNLRKASVALRVNKAMQTITWEDQQTELTVGKPVSSTAVLSSCLPVTYAYTQCLLTIEEGVIMPENEGEVTVIAYHPGNENYLPTMVIMQTFVIRAAEEPMGTEQLTSAQQAAARKYIHEGQVRLDYNGHTYDAKGTMIQAHD